MRGAVSPHPHTPSWGGAHLKAQGQIYLFFYLHVLIGWELV